MELTGRQKGSWQKVMEVCTGKSSSTSLGRKKLTKQRSDDNCMSDESALGSTEHLGKSPPNHASTTFPCYAST
jgi:hypothetical protein